MATTVFDQTAGLTGTDGGALQNTNIRIVISAAALSAATGTQVRITLRWGTGSGNLTGALDALYFGRQAAAGHTYDFNGNQAQVTFSGGSSANSSAAGVVTSDFVTLGGGESYDNTKNYVVAFHLANSATPTVSEITSATNVNEWDDNGAVSNAATSVVTLPNGAFSGFLDLIEKIEIQAAAGGGSPLRRNASLDGLGASGPFFSNPLARSVLGWRPSIVAVRRKLLVPPRRELRLAA